MRAREQAMSFNKCDDHSRCIAHSQYDDQGNTLRVYDRHSDLSVLMFHV
jgi:hypothetical protein